MHKDMCGEDLRVGDIVIAVEYGRYPTSRRAIVDSFTPQKVRVRYIKKQTFDNATTAKWPCMIVKTFNQENRWELKSDI